MNLELVSRLIDPLALALVGGGSLAVAALRSTGGDLRRAWGSLRPLFHARPDLDAEAARRAVGRIEAIAHIRTIACADRVETAGRFLKRAAEALADARTADGFARWGEDEIARRRARHDGAIGFWRMLADSAPAMGMIGTVLGLIELFQHMDEPAGIGPAMALALLTTFYGILLAGGIAGPIAARLERLSQLELAWQQSAIDRLRALAHDELDRPVVQMPSRLRAVP